ncbi:hypothetical protein J4558_22270 [Leptolyngbya sp. 15MV]|nr:hypothetical protein J4558_22270 [Leptolyngbya sp. 15MV]
MRQRGPVRRVVGPRLGVLVAFGLWAAQPAAGQVPSIAPNPVYTDEAPIARETLARVGEFLAAGNRPQAVRELQRLLDEHGHRVLVSAEDPALSRSVRRRVHEILLSDPGLLELYRSAESATAQRMLEDRGAFLP